MLASGDRSDVQFCVGRDFGAVKVFKAHKNIISIRSPVFCAMFYGSLAEKDPQIDVPDCVPDAFANMLSCMYTDTVENLSADNVVPTLRCADKNDFPELTSLGLKFVETRMNIGDCLVTLERAIQWRADDMVEKCLQLVERQSGVILQTEQFKAIAQDTLKMILQRNALRADEHDIYLAVERWAVEACKRKDLEPSAANRRTILGDALYLVRFPLMNATQLANGPGKSGVLLESELLSVFLYQNGVLPSKLPFTAEKRGTDTTQRTGQAEFYKGEEMFVLSSAGGWWHPATFLWKGNAWVNEVMWCASGNHGKVLEGETVRSADILQSGQKLYCMKVAGRQRAATYVKRLNRSKHLIRFNASEEAECDFSELMLHNSHVVAWKASKIG
ncbi:BTB/POZ domain-containing protein 6-B-like [Paramacrobiotus metropolitanus]|uniref:BTB/POZ domain-containing protein 6-B-like n=1 Tax=Paramacrobiotus metropolitanus TaxID=2943436 RepID=UPI0024462F4B|nr:BTB/POZ domain-containing protein 6-B-like [Paramacrobiotus metropolitanus]